MTEIKILEEERTDKLSRLEKAKEFPNVPCFKNEADARDYVMQGNTDFIAPPEYWAAQTSPVKRGIIRATTDWSVSDEGYVIIASTVEACFQSVNHLLNQANAPLVYFRLRCPGIPRPKTSSVDEALQWMDELKMEYSGDNYIDEEYYDR